MPDQKETAVTTRAGDDALLHHLRSLYHTKKREIKTLRDSADTARSMRKEFRRLLALFRDANRDVSKPQNIFGLSPSEADRLIADGNLSSEIIEKLCFPESCALPTACSQVSAEIARQEAENERLQREIDAVLSELGPPSDQNEHDEKRQNAVQSVQQAAPIPQTYAGSTTMIQHSNQNKINCGPFSVTSSSSTGGPGPGPGVTVTPAKQIGTPYRELSLQQNPLLESSNSISMGPGGPSVGTPGGLTQPIGITNFAGTPQKRFYSAATLGPPGNTVFGSNSSNLSQAMPNNMNLLSGLSQPRGLSTRAGVGPTRLATPNRTIASSSGMKIQYLTPSSTNGNVGNGPD